MRERTIFVVGRLRRQLRDKLKAAVADARVVEGTEPEAFQRSAADATVILAWGASRDQLRGVLAMTPHVSWVHVMSAGLDSIMSPELMETPAVLTNGKGVFSASLGEWVLGAMLYFAKDMRRLIRSQEAGVWDPFDVECLSGKTVGIIGYGDIGRAVAARAKAMGMRVLGVTRSGPVAGRPDELADKVFSTADRIAAIEQSDYVVVTAPLTSDTRGLMGEAEIAAMRPRAVFVNIGRGPVVDEVALIRALSENRIKGAALDVFEQEPLPDGHPFFSLQNVLLSPHSADHTADWLDSAMQFFLENFERFRAGEPLLNVVEKKLGY